MDDPITIDLTVTNSPVTVALSTSAPALQVDVALTAPAVAVTVAEARDAYQLAVADGFEGTRAQWLASLKGEDGANAEVVILTLAEYLALAPAVQMDGRWYLIPTT